MRRAAKPQPALGAAIRELRAKRGLTQEALAQEAEITVGHLSPRACQSILGCSRGHCRGAECLRCRTGEAGGEAQGLTTGSLKDGPAMPDRPEGGGRETR